MSDALKLACLLYFNGTDGATSFTDSSVNALTIANTDTARAELDTADKKFGSASCLMSLGSNFTAEDFSHEGVNRYTSTTRIYGANIAIGTEIYNATRNEYSYVTDVVLDEIIAGSPPTSATKYYIDISPSITGQDAGDTIYYAGTDVTIPNTGNVLDLTGDFSISMWVKKSSCAGTFFDMGYYDMTIESDATVKVRSLSTTLITSTDAISNSTFTWVVLTRVGRKIALYIDGAHQGEYLNNEIIQVDTSNFQLGNILGATGAGFAGCIDEVQIWNGVTNVVASLPSGVDVPSAEYTDNENIEMPKFNLTAEITASQIEVVNFALQAEITVSNIEVSDVALQVEVSEFPLITTNPATNVDTTTVTMNGTFYSGISSVVEMGFVYSTSANPTTADTKEVISTDSGDLSANVIGLTGGTTYYYRAFLTDGVDTYYGDDEEFTTSAILNEGPILEILEYQSTETAEAGTTTTTINITGHGLTTLDFIVNETRRTTQAERGSRLVYDIGLTADVIPIADAITGQATGDDIRLYKFINRTEYIRTNSFTMSKRTGGLSDVGFTLVTTTSWLPVVGQYMRVNWYDGATSTRLFTGTIRDIKMVGATEMGASDVLFLECKCVGYNQIPTRRTIEIFYEYNGTRTYGDVVQDMLDNYLFQDGVRGGTIDAGIVIPDDWVSDVISISEVLDECASKCNYQWLIDKNGLLKFYQDPSSIPTADYDITDAGAFKDYINLSFESSIDDYINKMFIAGGRDAQYLNDIIIGSEDFTESTAMQERCAGTGVYGDVHRDAGIVESDYVSAEAGTTTTNVTVTGHNQEVGWMIWNTTRDEYRQITAVVDADNFTVEAVTSQTTGDDIVFFAQANQIIQNEFKLRGFVPKKFQFETKYPNFEPGEKIQVDLAKYGISTEYYVIDDVDLQDLGGVELAFRYTVKCSLRDNSNFSTQRLPAFYDYFGGL